MEQPFKKKILIVDDHPMMRKGLASSLESEPGFEIVLQLESAEEVLKAYNDVDLDLMIIDVSLPGMNGIELVKNIHFQNPDQKMLVVSRHDESLYAERALRAGAKGYVMKFEPSEVLVKAVQRVLNGGIYISDAINEKLLMSAVQGKKNPADSPIDLLSDRELEVFELIGRGKSSSDIAKQLHLAPKTVETYRWRIKEKLSFKNSNEMMFNAVKWVENEEMRIGNGDRGDTM